jgi:hypothetical protein
MSCKKHVSGVTPCRTVQRALTFASTLRARTGRAMFAQHELALGDHADHNSRATMAKELMQ